MLPDPEAVFRYEAKEEDVASARERLVEILTAIERECGDDFCEELSIAAVLGDGQLRRKGDRRLLEAQKRLSKIYQIAHGWNPAHSCHHVHESWRGLTSSLPPAE